MNAALLLTLLLAQAKDDPETELRSFRVPDGFEVNLFASEKEGVVKPIQMRWDPDGRLWITCSPSYPQLEPGQRPDDHIVVVQDSDGDGRADKSSVFAHGLMMPMGLELGQGGLFVGDGTEIVHLSDSDGDGRADRRRVVLRGFFSGDSHQNINNFIWGPGGELLFCQGLHAFGQVETPWGIEKLHKAGVWRLRPRTLRLDPFFGDDMGPQNPYGVLFDDWGQPLLVAGNGQGVYYLLPAMIRTRHFKQYDALWNRGAKFGGCDLLESSHLPDEVRGRLVAGSFMNNSVYWWDLGENGAGFRVKELPPLVVSSHVSFRPTDIKVGPDGAIYVCDWYNPVIGHYQASLRHPDRDKTHGRIWRISAKGRTPVKQPALKTLATPAVLDQFKSPERWTRYQAKRVLADRDPAEVAAATARWTEGVTDERLLLEALGLFESHEIVEPKLLGRLLKAQDPRARAYAAGVIAHWHDRLENPLDLLARAAADEHPRVRLASVVAASYVPDARAVEIASSVADRPMDSFILHALTQAVHALKPHWKPAFDAGRLSFGGKAERLQAVLRADGSKDVLKPLVALLRSEQTSPESRQGIRLTLARVGGPQELDAVLESSPWPSAPLLQELATAARVRRVAPTKDPAEQLNSNLMLSDGAHAEAVTLAGLWKVETLRKQVEIYAGDTNSGRNVRRAAMEALADLGGESSRALLLRLAREGKQPEARVMAAVALSRLHLADAAGSAAAILAEGDADPSAIVAAFLARQGGAEALATSLSAVKVPGDTAKLALRALSAEGRQDPALRDVLGRAAGITTAAPDYSPDFVKALAAEAARDGDPARGEQVFRGALTNCVSCHAIGGGGGRAGPDLGPVGTALPADILVESILWPNRQVKEGYTTTVVMTAAGEIVQGYRVSEDKQELVLRVPQTDERVRVAVRDIKARKDTGSLMPDGLTSSLTRTELRDLVRFLSELGKPGPWRVPDKPFVRRWLASPDGKTAGPWIPRFSLVSGEVPVDVPGWLRFEVDVLKRGRFVLRFNDVKLLNLQVDDRELEAREVELAEGRHVIGVRVDRAGNLGCVVEPAPGSAGEAQPVN